MSRSETDICNSGLMELGAPRIINMNESSVEANLCKQFYTPSVEEVLRLHDWNCAGEIKVIASDSSYDGENDFTYAEDYRYLLPVNPYCLKVRKFNDGKMPYTIRGRYLYSDQDACELEYTKLITNPNDFDPLLAECIAIKMAIKMSFPLAKSKSLRDELVKYLDYIRKQARVQDGDEQYEENEEGSNDWLEAGR